MRTLLIRPGAIGDCIRCFPEMESLRSAYTEVWISRPLVPLVMFASRVRALAETGLDLVGLPGVAAPERTWDELRSFDRVYSWYGTQRPEFREALRGLPVTFLPAIPTGAPVGIPRLPLNGPRHGNVILHPFSGSPKKNWPLEEFRKLAKLLGEVQWTCGVEEEFAGAVRMERLDELGRWIAGASLYIGNDSGITHLAAAVGTRTLAIFGPTDPAIWCPAGENVRWLSMRPATEVYESLRSWRWI